jgi:hypothetical protein
MKQIQYILCVSMCVVSSIGLWSMETGSAGAGTGAGAASGLVGGAGAGDARSFTDDEVRALRTQYDSLTKQFMDRLEKAYYFSTGLFSSGPVDAGEPTNSDLVHVRITKTYTLFVAALRKRVELARIAYSKDYPDDGALDVVLNALEDSYKSLFQDFTRGQTNETLSDNLYSYVPLSWGSLSQAQRQATSSWGVASIKPTFKTDWERILKKAENGVNAIAWRYDDLRHRRILSTHAQAAAYDALQPQLVADRALADHKRQQQLADGAVTEELERARLQREAAHQIEVQTTVNAALQDANRERELAVQGARDTAQAARHTKIIAAGKWMLVAAALSAVGGMGAYFGLRHYFKERPKIIGPNDTSIGSGLKKAKYPAANLDRLILTPELEKMVPHKFKGIELAIQRMLPLSNMMFFGPAGTGKTMAAQEFVRHLSGKRLVDHIIVRGPAFKQFNKTSEAISALKSVIRFAEASYKKRRKPVVIVFDEAETLFADRAQPEFATEITRDLVTVMTSEISSAVNKHIMFILSTNFPDRIDKALLNRIDESNRIRFVAPGQAERESLLRLYLDEALTQQGFTVSDEVMDAIPQLAKSINGMVGRQISSMVTQSIYRLLNEGEIELTLPLFKETIAATMAQKDYAAY